MTYPTFDEIIDALQGRHLEVAQRYAPGGTISNNRYWALNPFRGDTKKGSFYVALAGAYAGRYRDEASGDMGDMLDLIRNAMNMDQPAALAEARAFLGMADETPAQKALRKRQVARAKQGQIDAEKKAEADVGRKRARAHAIYLAHRGDWANTPVEHYLAGRCITLASLGRQPNVIAFAPKLHYYQTDLETGEVFEGDYPAMIAAIHGPATDGQAPKFYGLHQTFLGQLADGRWVKRDHPDLPDAQRIPKAKILMGSKLGGFIRLWTGIGPRGGKAAPLARAKGAVWITEGIEDGLSAACLDPNRRVLAGIDLGNLKSMVLPKAIDHVTLAGDNDTDPKLIKIFNDAVARFRSEGRAVGVWRNTYGGKDLNDALVKFTLAELEGEAG